LPAWKRPVRKHPAWKRPLWRHSVLRTPHLRMASFLHIVSA
jgi:hypothetical protein